MHLTLKTLALKYAQVDPGHIAHGSEFDPQGGTSMKRSTRVRHQEHSGNAIRDDDGAFAS